MTHLLGNLCAFPAHVSVAVLPLVFVPGGLFGAYSRIGSDRALEKPVVTD